MISNVYDDTITDNYTIIIIDNNCVLKVLYLYIYIYKYLNMFKKYDFFLCRLKNYEVRRILLFR